MFDNELKRTMKSMMIGSAIYNFFLLIVSIVFFVVYYSNKNEVNFLSHILKNGICLVIGFLISLVGIYSIAMSVAKAALSRDESFAKKHVRVMSVVRLLIFCIILIFIIDEKRFGIAGGMMFVLSVMGIKLGAYVAPLIERNIR